MRLVLLLIALCALALGVSVKLAPHESRCFWTDPLEKGNVIASRFQITEGGPNGVDMRILTPAGNIFFEVWNRLDGTYSFVVNDPGQYAVCFANSNFMMETEKRVSITLNDPENVGSASNLANEANLSPLEQAIVALSAEVASVQREQQYLKARERAHRETTESTNERVAYWSLAELCLLILVSVWQIWMLKRSFEVVRSV